MKTYEEWLKQIVKELTEDDQAYYELEYGEYDEWFDMTDLDARARNLIEGHPNFFPIAH